MTRGPRRVQPADVLARGCAALFIVSTAFPIAAGLLPADRVPTWVGIADVVLAAAVVVSSLAVVSRHPGPFAAPVVATSLRT